MTRPAPLMALLQAAAGEAGLSATRSSSNSSDDSDGGAACTAVGSRHPDEIELDTLAQLQQLCDASRAMRNQQLVPPLFPQPGSVQALLRREAQQRKLQAHAERCLSDDELRVFGALLQEHAALALCPPADAADSAPPLEAELQELLRINYDGFSTAGRKALSHPEICAAAVAPFTQPDVFLRFERDAAGCISLPLLLHFVSCHTSALRVRLQLSMYDEDGTGQLRVHQLQQFLEAAVPMAPMLQGMEPSFLPHYLHIACRKLLLFHGRRNLAPRGGGSSRQRPMSKEDAGSSSSSSSELVVRLTDLVNSPVMAELQELLSLGPGAEQERDLFSNWFSLQSTQRVLATFNAWDVDGSGTLSKAEFSAISQGAMSELFISRVFEEHVAQRRGATWPPPKHDASAPGSRRAQQQRASSSSSDGDGGSSEPGSPASSQDADGGAGTAGQAWPPPLPPGAAGPRDEMDLLAFADFVLAWDHRNQPSAIAYFFKIFDIHHRGYLTSADLYTFFREIHALWVAMGEYSELEVYDVLDELMDMVQPAVPGRLTKADLGACKMAGTVFSVLSNVDQFYQYNFRENFMHGGGGGGGEGGAGGGGGGEEGGDAAAGGSGGCAGDGGVDGSE